VPRFSNIENYVNSVKQAAILREQITIGNWLMNAAWADDAESEEITRLLNKKLDKLLNSQARHELISSATAAERTLKRLEHKWANPSETLGLKTGYYKSFRRWLESPLGKQRPTGVTMAITITQFRYLEKVRVDHDAVKAELRALMIRRAQREIDNPDLFFQYDQEHRDLTNQIYKLRDRFGDLSRELASAEGRLLTFSCADGLSKEHKYCRGEFKSNGIWMQCGCKCHKTKKGDRKK
jgi:hypothetical protein